VEKHTLAPMADMMPMALLDLNRLLNISTQPTIERTAI